MRDYYLIKQKINNRFQAKFKIYCPTNTILLKQLLEIIPGYLSVHFVNSKDNSQKNLTKEFGRDTFSFQTFRQEHDQVFKAFIRFTIGYGGWVGDTIRFFTVHGENSMPKKFFTCGEPCGLSIGMEAGDDLKLDYQPTYKFEHSMESGKAYERFVGSKYEELGYKVTYHGINHGVKDGGIDLIAENENSIFLIQCKNWIAYDGFHIQGKDLRAFIGDCYLYFLQPNTIKDKSIGFHFIISDHDMLDQSAKYFIEQNKVLRFKCVPFENEEKILQ